MAENVCAMGQGRDGRIRILEFTTTGFKVWFETSVIFGELLTCLSLYFLVWKKGNIYIFLGIIVKARASRPLRLVHSGQLTLAHRLLLTDAHRLLLSRFYLRVCEVWSSGGKRGRVLTPRLCWVGSSALVRACGMTEWVLFNHWDNEVSLWCWVSYEGRISCQSWCSVGNVPEGSLALVCPVC